MSEADFTDTTVLIPAAGPVPEGVLGLANISCPAMIPVAGRPVIHWTISYLHSLGLRRFLVAVARRGLFVEDFVECAFGSRCEVEFLVPERTGGLGDTVQALAAAAGEGSALVVLGDTHFQLQDPALLADPRPAVLVSPVEESYRWCIAESREDGTLNRLRDKQPGLVPAGDSALEALIGVYHFPDLDHLRAAADSAVAQATQADQRTEMAAILEGIAATSPIRVERAGDWLDCGNPDHHASSHRALLQKRDFNELEVDPHFGLITKRSRKVEKFIDEINFLRLLPPKLQVLFPRLVDYSTDWHSPHLTQEYYGYPNLADAFVFESLDPGLWERVFQHLRHILEEAFMTDRRPLPAGAVRQMYLEKTRHRLAELNGPPELLRLVEANGWVRLNGRRVRSMNSLWPQLERAITELDASAEGAVMHGDLCLSNILYDLAAGICKLIDPRGSFGVPGIYGDPRYDVAKLYHSVYGLYDLIVNDLFQVETDGPEVQLEIRSLPQHGEIRQRFEQVFFPTFDRRQVLLITALLFASMPALHYDKPRRQIAMYARALELLDEYFAS